MPQKQQPTIDQKLVLRDLLDRDLLRDLLENFSQFFRLRVQLLDDQGNIFLSRGDTPMLCSLIKGDEIIGQQCNETGLGLTMIPLEAGKPDIYTCFNGLNYVISIITLEFDEMGRALFGPFRTKETTLPDRLFKLGLPKSRIEHTLKKVPNFDIDEVKRITSFFISTMEIFLFLSAKRLLTSRLHLDTIFRAREEIFQEMENELRSEEDRAELERFKQIF